MRAYDPRRKAAFGGRLRPPFGGVTDVPLFPFSGGTFARASAATWWLGDAPLPVALLLRYLTGVLRQPARVNGRKGYALESARTNEVPQSSGNTGWGVGGGAAVTANQYADAAGTALGAPEVAHAASGASRATEDVGTLADNTNYVASMFSARQGVAWASDGPAIQLLDKAGGSTIVSVPADGNDQGEGVFVRLIGTAWDSSAGVTTPQIRHRNSSAELRDAAVWLMQLEAGEFATSGIETAGAAATRAADDLVIASADLGGFTSGAPMTFSVYMPHSSAQQAAQQENFFFYSGVAVNNYLSWEWGASQMKARAGGSIGTVTGVAWAAGATITFTIDTDARKVSWVGTTSPGSLSLSSAASYASTDYQMGNNAALTGAFHGLMTEFYAADPVGLLDYGEGTFARASAATHWEAATNTFTRYATGVHRQPVDLSGVRAFVFEGARENLVEDSNDVTAATWTLPAGVTLPVEIAGPDGVAASAKSYQMESASGGYFQYDAIPNADVADSTPMCVSALALPDAGTGLPMRLLVRDKAGANGGILAAGTTPGWAHRALQVRDSATGATDPFFRYYLTENGTERSAIWGAQFELAEFPSSTIETSGAAATRAADVLSFPGVGVGLRLNQEWTMQVRPSASSAEMVAEGASQRLIHQGATAQLGLIISGGANVVIRFINDAATLDTSAITFDAHQELTITCDPSAGTVTVAGATTGDGTYTGSAGAWAASGTYYIGSSNGTVPFFGLLSEPWIARP